MVANSDVVNVGHKHYEFEPSSFASKTQGTKRLARFVAGQARFEGWKKQIQEPVVFDMTSLMKVGDCGFETRFLGLPPVFSTSRFSPSSLAMA